MARIGLKPPTSGFARCRRTASPLLARTTNHRHCRPPLTMQASVQPLTRVFQDGVAADVSRRSLQADISAPTDVGGYALAAGPAAATVSELAPTATIAKGWLAVYADLFKARLTSLVLLTTMVGFYVGFRGPVDRSEERRVGEECRSR